MVAALTTAGIAVFSGSLYAVALQQDRALGKTAPYGKHADHTHAVTQACSGVASRIVSYKEPCPCLPYHAGGMAFIAAWLAFAL